MNLYGGSGSSKVDNFGISRKLICNVLLVLLLVPTLVLACPLSQIRRLAGWKLLIFHTPLLFGAPATYVPFEISRRGYRRENYNRVTELLCGDGESCTILSLSVSD